MYAFAFNKLPFWGDTDLEINQNIINQELSFPEDREISPGLKNLLERFLDKNPDTRITVKELKTNEWLNDGFHYSLN